jgi:urease gamma subunit
LTSARATPALAKSREDVINARGSLIHQLVAYNFPTDDNLPKLRFGNVQSVDIRAFAQALVSLSQAFAALDPETEEWARGEANMPHGTTTTQVVVPVPESPAPAAAQPSGRGDDEADGSGIDSGAKAAEGCGCGLRLAERRQPRGVERYVELAEIDQRITDAKTAVRVATQATRDALVRELAKLAAEAQAKGTLPKFASTQPPMVDKLTAEVRAVLEDFYAAGREQVAGELDRQRRGEPVAEEAVDARQSGETITTAEKPRKKVPALPDADDAIGDEAEMIARSIATGTQAGAALSASRVSSGVPLDPAAIIESITRSSDESALRFGATVSDVMQLGRAAEAQAQATDVEDGVYSAILDGAACDDCAGMDGEITEDLALAAGWTPNPDCAGGDRCRCLVFYELRQEGPA